MIADKLDDPDAAPSFSGQLLRAEEVAPKVAGLLDHPRPVLAIPRWRGVFVRLLDAFPGLATRLDAPVHGRRAPPPAALEEADRGGKLP